ncbi:polysaccharide biosynthesis/export family protein [Sphingomonas sp. C3-2]|uniref:polysaccharide biosynthesis/export family protein n=1 Tax=Sphingomonas sp. C3-2 TaxID=3062169 RepID=UPI00294AD347|nr:polysaccharide biosynthesis/export family protein [Sphingomonas sp. C3-2]WOK35091.1 polysaccharide biosynthesis/export family protein [Sphingomonas sp. C3-2]
MRFVWIVALVGALCVSGCGGKPRLEAGPGLAVAETGQLPEPRREDLTTADRPYLIGPFDKLQISVFGVEDMEQKIQADASGRISFPLAGVIEAAGRTPGELATAIATRLRPYVRDPQVTVNLEETVSQVITVEGEVKTPGQYPVVGRMTLLRAIARAEGTSEFARLREVVIFRTVGNQRYAGLYDLKAIRQGAYEDPEVFANDVVIVGTSETRRIFKDVLAVSPAILAPLIYLIR